MNRREHWNAIHRAKREAAIGCIEPVPAISLAMLEAAGLSRDTGVLDVGGGESCLVDALLARGLRRLAVLDVSTEALDAIRARLGPLQDGVTWIDADVTGEWSLEPMDIWHDRAVFHFLLEAEDRARYVTRMKRTVTPHGSAIIATFAADGPRIHAGLPVARYSPDGLASELGPEFVLVESRRQPQAPPRGAVQYSRFRRVG